MNYVTSDVHGHLSKFQKMLKYINFSDNDTLYILGDIIDRGPDSIGLLKTIMNMPNVVFLIGNHEDMLIKAYKDNTDFGFAEWYANGGRVTDVAFQELSDKEQSEILGYLLSSYLVIPSLKVNNKYFYLAHSTHLSYPLKTELYYKDASSIDVNKVLWERQYTGKAKYIPSPDVSELYRCFKNHILICGHTKVQSSFFGKTTKEGHGRISGGYNGHVISIDCGCASGKNLGCLRLEDMKEFYVN